MRQIATFKPQGTTYRGSGDFKYYNTKGQIIPGRVGTFTITAEKILVSTAAEVSAHEL